MTQLRTIAIVYLYLTLAVFVMACKSKHPPVIVEEQVRNQDIVIPIVKNDSKANAEIIEPGEEEYATYFVVVADTGANYYMLRDKMMELNKRLSVPIDTMDRYYNAAKNLIALPDDYDDDIYAGDYFPRRDQSQNLSLEYLSFYNPKASGKTIALVTGIYLNENSADSSLAVVRKEAVRGFKLKSNIYVGCIH